MKSLPSRRATLAASRSGASLVLALFVVAALVSLALFASSLARGQAARVSSRAGRAALRQEAEEALARAAWAIEADTNGVDALSEPWATASAEEAASLAAGEDGVFVLVEDERARLGLPDAGEAAFAALLSGVAGLDAASAAGLARASLAAGAAVSESVGRADGAAPAAVVAASSSEEAGKRPLSAAEALLETPSAAPGALEAALPFVSAHAGPCFNVNTVGREVLVASALGAGATPGGAEGLWLRLEMARGRGDVFREATQKEAMKLLRGEGDVPTAEEIAALAAIQRLLCVESGLFRLTAVARRGGLEAGVQCVYERGTGRILRRAEW